MSYTSTTVAWRGKVARLLAQVQKQKPAQGERSSTMPCICGATLRFNIQSTGISRGQCSVNCGVTWYQ